MKRGRRADWLALSYKKYFFLAEAHLFRLAKLLTASLPGTRLRYSARRTEGGDLMVAGLQDGNALSLVTQTLRHPPNTNHTYLAT